MSANDQKLFEHFILFSNFIDLFPRDNQIQLLTAELKTIDFNCKYTILLIFSIHESTIVHLQLSAILYLGIFLYLLYKFCYLFIVIFIVFEIYLNLWGPIFPQPIFSFQGYFFLCNF